MNGVNPQGAPVILSQAVSDGVYMYGLRSDNTLWRSPLAFPLVWKPIPAVPNSETVTWMGVTYGEVKNLPFVCFYVLCNKTGNFYFWDGSVWNQENTT